MRGSLTIDGAGAAGGCVAFEDVSGRPFNQVALAAALGDKVHRTGDTMSGGLKVADKLTVFKTGDSSELAGMEVAADPLNPGNRSSLFILPSDNYGRMFFGKSGLDIYAINLPHVLGLESAPGFEMRSCLHVVSILNTFINRGAGGTEIGANHPDNYGLDIYRYGSFNTATIDHRTLNVHWTRGVSYFGPSIDRENHESANLGYDIGAFHLWSAKAGTGTAHPLAHGFDSTERIRMDADGTKMTGMTWYGTGNDAGPGTLPPNGSFEHRLPDRSGEATLSQKTETLIITYNNISHTMPAAVSLNNDVCTVAFNVPAGALGFVLWNKSAAELRVRLGRVAASSGGNEGLPLAAGSVSPQYLTHYFEAPLRKAVRVCIYQNSGGVISSGVGYDVISL